jgi:nucleoside-diphosphate-sugar epimerase
MVPGETPLATMNVGLHNRILLTGSTGTVGSAVLELLALNPRFEVHTIVRRPQAVAGRWIEHVLDLAKDDFVSPLSSLDFDFIIDCAQPRYEESGTWEQFGVAYIKKLESLCSSRTKRLIHTGGVWVYGNQLPGRLINEESPLNPLAYARPSLPILDHLNRSSRLPWVQLCPPSIVYGSQGPLLGIRDAVLKGVAVVIDDPSIECSVIERTDLARAYLALMEGSFPERLFMVAEPAPVSRLNLYGLAAKALHVPFSPRTREAVASELSKEDFEVASANQPVDSTLVRKLTNWANHASYEKDVRRFLDAAGTE